MTRAFPCYCCHCYHCKIPCLEASDIAPDECNGGAVRDSRESRIERWPHSALTTKLMLHAKDSGIRTSTSKSPPSPTSTLSAHFGPSFSCFFESRRRIFFLHFSVSAASITACLSNSLFPPSRWLSWNPACLPSWNCRMLRDRARLSH